MDDGLKPALTAQEAIKAKAPKQDAAPVAMHVDAELSEAGELLNLQAMLAAASCCKHCFCSPMVRRHIWLYTRVPDSAQLPWHAQFSGMHWR